MRGGLDDALDKLARRDELRRRAAQEATGTLPEVQELVEAIAGVVGRNQNLEVTVGVEGVGDPTLLHFFVEEGVVRVTADSTVAARVGEPRHADFDLEPEEPVEDTPPARSFDDRDRYDPGTGYDRSPYDGHHGYDDENTDDIEASRFRSPFAADSPPTVPPSGNRSFFSDTDQGGFQPIPEPMPAQPRAAEPQERSMPTPLPEPIPLRNVDSQETEQAAKRLAALLRDDPTLLRHQERS